MTTNPADGWSVYTGTWGTDFDRETSVLLGGQYSIKFISGTPADDPTLVGDYRPVIPGMPYMASIWVRADSIAAGNTMTAFINWYTSEKVYISQSVIHNAVLGAANTWEERSAIFTAPATAAFARLFIRKNNTAFNGYYGFADFWRAPRSFLAYRSAAVPASPTNIDFDNESYDYGNIFDTGTGKCTIPTDGLWHFYAQTYVVNLAAGGTVDIVLRNAGTPIAYGTTARAHALNDDCVAAVNFIGYLSKGDSIETYLEYSSGTPSVAGTVTKMTGVELGGFV